jgi:hypothetical protein
MTDSQSDLQGKRYIALVRSATDDPRSLARQREAIRSFAAKHGFSLTDEMSLLGMSQSETDGLLAELIKRKSVKNDFEVLLVATLDRLGRSGPLHMAGTVARLEKAGINIIAASESDFPWLLHASELHAAQVYARSLSQRICRSRQMRLSDGTMLYVSRPPYGIDRLYVDWAGKEMFVIQIQPDRSERQIHPQTGEVLRAFLPGRGYRKQADERIVLIPGAKDAVEVVRNIFKSRFDSGRSVDPIAAMLNTKGIPSPSGTHWSPAAVRRMTLNPIYLGFGIACRTRRPIVTISVSETANQRSSAMAVGADGGAADCGTDLRGGLPRLFIRIPTGKIGS